MRWLLENMDLYDIGREATMRMPPPYPPHPMEQLDEAG